jgi:hypothetical protein
MIYKKHTIFIIISATVVIGGALLATGRTEQVTAASVKATAVRPSLSVGVVQPSQAIWPLTLTANGALAAWQEDTIRACLWSFGPSLTFHSSKVAPFVPRSPEPKLTMNQP